MTALTDLSLLDRFKAQALSALYPTNVRTFYSPVDQVHKVELALIASATTSLTVAMYGFDDQDVADLIKTKMTNPGINVQLTLDKIEAGGAHERDLLAQENYPNSSVAIGSSEHGRIMHMKLIVVDGVVRMSGSTNLSTAGESLQDNELTVICDQVIAAEAEQRCNEIHAHMLSTAGTRGFPNPMEV